MAINLKYLAPFLVVVIIGVKDIFCAESSVSNPWNKNIEPVESLDNPLNNQKSTTTPWPELGQRGRPRNPQNNARDYVANPKPVPQNTGGTQNTGRDFISSPSNIPAPTPLANRHEENPQNPIWGRPGANPTRNLPNRNQATNSFLNSERGPVNEPVANNKRDYVANQNVPTRGATIPTQNPPVAPPRRDYVANPTPTKPNPGTNPIVQNPPSVPPPKRDYVANPNPGGSLTAQNLPPRRDYVANPTPVKPNSESNPIVQNPPPVPPPRRDYVANPKPGANPTAQNQPPVPPPRRDYVANPIPSKPNVGPNPTPQSPPPTPTRSYASIVGKVTTKNPVSFIGDSSPTTAKPAGQSPASSQNDRTREDEELREFSETLVRKDTTPPFKFVTTNFQGMTRSGSLRDEAPEPLIAVKDDVYSHPSIAKMVLLFNNYILDSSENEVYTAQEKIEENNFLDTVLATPVMQHTRNFLVQKGTIPKDPKAFRDILKTIWFNMYSRGGGRIGSSGFEHVFTAEIKNNTVSGLHNWLYFKEEEAKNKANYLGYMKIIEFDKGAVLKYHFNFHNIDKPVGSMFVGTSPEFEMALYSTCFLLRPDDVCPLRLGGKNFIIRTYTYRYRGKKMIGSAFPDI